MPGSNWRAAEGLVQISGQGIGGEAVAAAGVGGGHWRTQLPPGSRHRIVYKIVEKLRMLHPFAGQEDLQDLEKTALEFEENIFIEATSQSDYLRKISLQTLSFQMKSQNLMAANPLQSNASSSSTNPQDPGTHVVAAAGMVISDWRIQLQPESRQRIVNKIIETLTRHLPFSGEDGLEELKQIAVRFEENIHRSAISQSDYLRKISLKMLTLEVGSQNPMANLLQYNAASNGGNPQNPGNASVH